MKQKLMLLAALAVPTLANAALPESVGTAVTAAGTDVVAGLALMTGAAVLIWAARKVYHLFGR